MGTLDKLPQTLTPEEREAIIEEFAARVAKAS